MKKGISLFYLFFPLIIGGMVGLFISNYMDYELLNLPPLAPPKIFFPIAWSVIYLLMGISYYLWQKEQFHDGKVSFFYYLQLFVNVLWPIIFFALKWRFVAILWILLLDILVIYLLSLFSKEKKVCSYLNYPYLLWSLFATYLTIGIYILNGI